MIPETNKTRPRVLLIPNETRWILGAMCQQIKLALSDQFEFFIIPETLFSARPQLWDRILPEIDVIHCMTESAAGVMHARGGTFPPTVTWIHHVTQWSADHQSACEVSSAIVASTQDWKRRLAAFTAKPIHIVRSGVDPALFRKVADARRTLSIPEADFVVGFFGTKGSDRDNNRKGMDTFFEVLRRCSKVIPNFRVLLLGPGWDASQFEAEGIALTYPGFVPTASLPIAYSALDVYLMTARVEGGPCTVLESMACGTPVVATRVGLVMDVIVDGENSMSAEVGDADALTERVCRLASDRSLHALVTRRARETAAELTWTSLLAPLADVYRSVHPQPHSTAARARLVSEKVNRIAVSAEAVLAFRYAMKRGGKTMQFTQRMRAARETLKASGGWINLLRGVRLAARGEL